MHSRDVLRDVWDNASAGPAQTEKKAVVPACC
jgi:hypothetical protein